MDYIIELCNYNLLMIIVTWTLGLVLSCELLGGDVYITWTILYYSTYFFILLMTFRLALGIPIGFPFG